MRARVQRLVVFVALLALALGACRGPRQRAYTKDQERKRAAALLTAAPQPQVPINAVFDNKLRLIGVDYDVAQVRPGDTFTITWYWECLAEAPGDWKVFVHFEGKGKRSGHDHGPVGELFPIADMKPGQIIKDVQQISVMADFPDGTATMWAGIFDEKAWSEREQNVRMQIVGDPLTPKDGDRVQAGTIEISKSATPVKRTAANRPSADKRPRVYTVYKAPGPIAVDGKLDDAGWVGVPLTQPFVAPDSGEPIREEQKSEARMTWDDTYLYVAFTTKDSNIKSDYQGRDSTLWKQDVVEIYLDPGADSKDYLELQVAPTGEIFDCKFDSRRTPDWAEGAPKFTIDMIAKVTTVGTVNQPGDKDESWVVEVAIPWAQIPGGAAGRDGPFAVNLYRLDPEQGMASAWAPAGNDYHNIPEFGRVTFSQSVPPGAQ